jgi:hypothetical protein
MINMFKIGIIGAGWIAEKGMGCGLPYGLTK